MKVDNALEMTHIVALFRLLGLVALFLPPVRVAQGRRPATSCAARPQRNYTEQPILILSPDYGAKYALIIDFNWCDFIYLMRFLLLMSFFFFSSFVGVCIEHLRFIFFRLELPKCMTFG